MNLAADFVMAVTIGAVVALVLIACTGGRIVDQLANWMFRGDRR